jgi:hypothetical protein
MKPEDTKRFWDKVDKTSKCWIWTAAKDKDGYGYFKLDGHTRKAHRVSYEDTYGHIPDGLNVLHSCDNPPCVRPDHLFSGTLLENNDDRNAKGRTAAGERNGQAKLTWQKVIEIRKQYQAGIKKYRLLAAQFGVSCRTIAHIVKKDEWITP